MGCRFQGSLLIKAHGLAVCVTTATLVVARWLRRVRPRPGKLIVFSEYRGDLSSSKGGRPELDMTKMTCLQDVPRCALRPSFVKRSRARMFSGSFCCLQPRGVKAA